MNALPLRKTVYNSSEDFRVSISMACKNGNVVRKENKRLVLIRNFGEHPCFYQDFK